MRVFRCLACILALSAGFDRAGAQDIESGHRLARMWCANCHAVEAGGAYRDMPLSFAAIAAMPSTTVISLNAFLSTPHPTMPNYSLTRTEIADVSAYILSLSPPEVH